MEQGFPDVYYVDNLEKVADNRRNQVDDRIDHAVQQRKTET